MSARRGIQADMEATACIAPPSQADHPRPIDFAHAGEAEDVARGLGVNVSPERRGLHRRGSVAALRWRSPPGGPREDRP